MASQNTPQSGPADNQQKREFVRINVNLPITLELSLANGQTRLIQAVLVNLGGGGLRVATPVALTPGQAVHVKFPLAGLEAIRLDSEVLACRQAEAATADFHTSDVEYVLRFTHIPHPVQAELIRYIFQLEMVHRKAGSLE